MNHTQTITVGDGSGKRGNCLQAAVATFFDTDTLDAVPDFANFGPLDEGGYGVWWWDLLLGYFAARGYLIERHRPSGPGDAIPQARSLVFGGSPRGNGISHMVVGEGGEITWDPHPDRTGLVRVVGAYVPVRIDELRARARAWDERKVA